jgi:hypothetical protein
MAYIYTTTWHIIFNNEKLHFIWSIPPHGHAVKVPVAVPAVAPAPTD